MLITHLAPRHAAEAARLHRAGQPGAFLTMLGPEVLTLIYEVLPASSTGFGYVAVQPAARSGRQSAMACEPGGDVVGGFVSATTSTGRLFAELGTRRLVHFLPLLLRRFVQQPRLFWLSLQTVLYPVLASGHEDSDPAPAAELLSIMVEPSLRGRGIGAALLQTLCSTCASAGIEWLDVTVAADNSGARRFYERHGFRRRHDFVIYGREMCGYRVRIEELRN
jgi:GNAT superfamily N-acetyltransferase